MTVLKLYEGDKPVVVSPDAILALVAFIAKRGEKQAFFDAAKDLKSQLTVSKAFRKTLLDFMTEKKLKPKLDDPLGFEGLFDALALIDSEDLGEAFDDLAFPEGAEVVAERDLVNFVKEFLFKRIKDAGPVLGMAAKKNKKVDQVVSSPAGTTTCFPK